MIKLSQMTDYAVVLCGHLARCGGYASAAEIAAATGIPAPTVAKLLSAMTRAGLLVSRRGASGGFVLARAAGRITLGDIVEAAEGPIALVQCLDDGREEECGIESLCAMRPHWRVINRALRTALADVTLAELAGLEEMGGSAPGEADTIGAAAG